VLMSGYSRWRVWLSSVAESSPVGVVAWDALLPFRLLKRCPIMSGSGRIPPWKRARCLSSEREGRRGCGGLEQCDVLVDPWQSEALVAAGWSTWGTRLTAVVGGCRRWAQED
jgi:hypothetical protein